MNDLLEKEFLRYSDKWETIDSGGDFTHIDFAISQNTDKETNETMLCMQVYNTENGDNNLIGVIYLNRLDVVVLAEKLSEMAHNMDYLNNLIESEGK